MLEVKRAGWDVSGKPERKPRHVEVLAQRDAGDWTGAHMDFAGAIYKQEPASAEKRGLSS
ncbi:MAG TPA: hypothetical protein DCM50_11240 [Stenotrophomonas sp.]|nr:hypothetical protein [Stenotrophomonas sp.]